MSSDSDEPLSFLKKAIPGPSNIAEDPDFEVKKPRKRKKKKVQNLKLILRQPSESPKSFPPKERNVRYYASQAAVERPQDVWLYIKDLNPSGPYSCLLCTEWFLNKAKLVVHFILNHKKDYCGICRYFVDNRETWLLHCGYHVPVNCSQCPLHFHTEADLRVHFSEVHGSVHCRFCTFMMPNEQYHHHLYQRHKITDVANKDLQVIWETEYEGSPKFNCALCLKSGTAAVEFVNHYMGYHKFVLKCFASLLSGFDVPFSVCGANISNSFLESALNKHARVGYVERDRNLEEQKVVQEAETDQGSLGLFQVLIPEIKQEMVSDTEDNIELMEVEIENEEPKPLKKSKTTKDDPIMNYKGEEDFDITLSELIIMNNCYVDYLNIAMQCVESNTVSIDSTITYNDPNEPEGMILECSLCPAEFPSMRALGSHMVKMHGVKKVPTFFCRLCVATFDNEAEYNSHSSEELAEFEDLWICQFCDMEFDGRRSARRHLNDHYGDMKLDNCFSPQLGFKCRYCPTLFWNELDREGHHNRVHFVKHKEDFYKCNECSDIFSDKTWFVHHTRQCHPDSMSIYMMKCAVCCHVFPTVSKVKEHFYKEHPEATKIFCSLDSCRFRPFSQSKSFKMHLQTFHGRNSRQQERTLCVVCDREFPSVRACSSHMATAHGPGRFKCKLCGDVLQSSDERKLHFMLQHPGQLPHECNVCKRSFQNKSSLYMHRQEHVNNGEHFKCKYCGKHFMKKDSFREHVLIHEGPRHTCSYCPMRFVQRSNMLRHERRHTGERPYSCSYCGRAFSDKGACNSHMRIHKPHETNPCPYCGQKFVQKSKLRYHIRRHTGENLETCFVCYKRFTCMPSLKEHMKTHKTTDLETCYVCSKLFTSMSAVREHMKTHEKGQRTTCPICNRAFQSYSAMGRHVRDNHSEGSAQISCPICEASMVNQVALRYHVMTHSKVKHVKCRVCNKDYSCRKTMVKHLQRDHGVEGPTDTTRAFYTELDPRQCQLGLDEATISNIFGPTKNRDTDVLITDYITFPKVIPTKSHDSDQREEAETEAEEEGNSEEPAEEQPVPEAVLKKKKNITYQYEEIGNKKKKHKKKKKKKRRKSSEAESDGPTEAEMVPEKKTQQRDFITIKLEPIDDEEYQD